MAPRTKSTPYAVLGLLSLTPMSGYDIRREAASSVGHFWSESFGQIYPALRDLSASGLIRRRPGKRGGGRDRQVYEITDRGREALRAWRLLPPRPAPVRNELLLKLFFADAASAGHDAAWIADLLRDEKARLASFRDLRRQLNAEHPNHPSLPFWLAALSYGEHRSRAVARWCAETLRALRAVGPTSHGGAPVEENPT